jgi:hypothetical protein
MSTLIFKNNPSGGGKAADESLTPEDLALIETMMGNDKSDDGPSEYKIK